METDNENGNETPTAKNRKYKDAVDASSDVGEGPVIGSEVADMAQAGFEDEITA